MTVLNANFCTITRYIPGGRLGMLYRPSSFVSPGNVTLVSTFVASTFTPAMTPPVVSVTRPVKVAVGPARREFVSKVVVKNTRKREPERECAIVVLQNLVELRHCMPMEWSPLY